MQQLQNLFRKARFFTARQMDLKKKLCCQSVVKKLRAKETEVYFTIYPVFRLFLFSMVEIIYKDP